MVYKTTKTIKGNQYDYIVRSEREGDKVRQIYVKYLGPHNKANKELTTTRKQKSGDSLKEEKFKEDMAGRWEEVNRTFDFHTKDKYALCVEVSQYVRDEEGGNIAIGYFYDERGMKQAHAWNEIEGHTVDFTAKQIPEFQKKENKDYLIVKGKHPYTTKTNEVETLETDEPYEYQDVWRLAGLEGRK